MDLLTHLLICGLAVYRLAEIIVIDDGPFGIFPGIRGWLYRNAAGDHNRTWQRLPLREIYKATTCVYCTGVWLALAFALTFFYQHFLIDFFLIVFAIAGLQSVLATKTGRN